MSITTMPLKRVAELNYGRIGLDDYPIFDEGHRGTLNEKIFDRYMNREIGQETDSLFIHMMRRRMREIMPYYNQLYESEKLDIDPLNTMDVTTTGTTNTDMTGTSTSDGTSNTDMTEDSESDNDSTNESSSKSRAMGSQTPQVRLSPDEDYADSISDSWSENTSSGTAKDTRSGTSNESGTTSDESGTQSNTTAEDETRRHGFEGSQVEMLEKLRASFLNIDRRVIEDLEDLFMLTWYNDDYITDHNSTLYGRVI